MGISSSKSTSTNKPIYSSQIEGAGNTLSNAYNTNAPKIQGVTDQITGLVPGMIEKYNAGNPAVNAATGYITNTLSGDPTHNPFLDQQIQMTDNNVRNQTEGALGLRGQTGGSSYADIISRNLANNEGTMRYNDYNTEMQRRAQAAGMAPGVAAADTLQIAPLLGVADAAQNPVKAAAGYAAGMGGLLGQYQTTKTKTSQPWGALLAQAAANAAAAYAGG